MKRIQEAQKYLQEIKADGWLLYDFHRNNPLAHQVLQIAPDHIATRRFFYWIPAHGAPIRLVHAIESGILDHLPGDKRTYLTWQSLESEVGKILKGAKRVAMEYSPKNAIPYVSRIDAGTADLVRSFGVEIVSSGTFLPHFTAELTEAQGQSHIRAGQALDRIVASAWEWIAEHLKKNQDITEYDVQQKIVRDYEKFRLGCDEPPIVAVNAHSADPHFGPSKENPTFIRKGDFILIDLFAKEKAPDAIFGDITRVGVAAELPTPRQREIFSIVREAQIAATELVKMRFAANKPVYGYEVDDAARKVVKEAGFGDQFIHRTGHSIELSLHGSGAHMDNLEMHDSRPILPATCFSIEPGIYLPGEFGVRLEYDLYVHRNGHVEIVGGEQNDITCLL